MSLVVTACASKGLKRDYSKSPLDSNYHSALIRTPFNTFYGVAVDQADTDRPFSFSVQGIYQGTINVSSAMCGFNETKYYNNSEEVSFSVTLKGERCLFGITIMPQFTTEESDGVEWRGVSGILLLRRAYQGLNLFAVRSPRTKPVTIKPPAIANSELAVFGCGILFHQNITSLPTFTLDPVPLEGDCVVEGFSRYGNIALPFTYYISRYSPNFSNLSFPKIGFNGSTMKVDAESSVSLMSFQSVSTFGRSYTFDYDATLNRFLSVYTSKGRTAYCNVSGFGDVQCFN